MAACRSQDMYRLKGRPVQTTRGGRIYSDAVRYRGADRQCDRIWLRNSLVRSDCGLLKKASGAFCSMISPPSMKMMRSATVRAKPISCVTTIMVMPVPRSEEHTSELQSLMRISYAVCCLKKKK